MNRELAATRLLTHGHTSKGRTSHEYHAWAGAIKRCTNPKTNNFHNYGGRGIKVCQAWLDDFGAFLRDMGPCPPGLTLERNDVNGSYDPENCRWATRAEQFANMRKNRYVDLADERLTVAEAARRHGMSPYVLYARLNLGWSLDRALTTPIHRHRALVIG